MRGIYKSILIKFIQKNLVNIKVIVNGLQLFRSNKLPFSKPKSSFTNFQRINECSTVEWKEFIRHTKSQMKVFLHFLVTYCLLHSTQNNICILMNLLQYILQLLFHTYGKVQIALVFDVQVYLIKLVLLPDQQNQVEVVEQMWQYFLNSQLSVPTFAFIELLIKSQVAFVM